MKPFGFFHQRVETKILRLCEIAILERENSGFFKNHLKLKKIPFELSDVCTSAFFVLSDVCKSQVCTVRRLYWYHIMGSVPFVCLPLDTGVQLQSFNLKVQNLYIYKPNPIQNLCPFRLICLGLWGIFQISRHCYTDERSFISLNLFFKMCLILFLYHLQENTKTKNKILHLRKF